MITKNPTSFILQQKKNKYQNINTCTTKIVAIQLTLKLGAHHCAVWPGILFIFGQFSLLAYAQ